MIYTGNFNMLRSSTAINGVISIARKKPYQFNITHELKELSPSWHLLSRYKSSEISEEEYIAEFHEEMESVRLDEVISKIKRIESREVDATLMCYCGQKDFCHRHLVANLLESAGDIKIKELKHDTKSRDKGRIK